MQIFVLFLFKYDIMKQSMLYVFQALLSKLEEIGNNTDFKPEINTLITRLSNIERILHNPTAKPESSVIYNVANLSKTPTNTEMTVDEDIRRAVLNVFGPKPSGNSNNSPNADIQVNIDEDLRRSVVKLFSSKPTTEPTTEKPPCSLIDIRGDIPKDCVDMMSSMKTQKSSKVQKKRKRRPKLNVRSDANGDDDNFDESAEENDYMISTTDATTTENIHQDIAEETNQKKIYSDT